MNTKEYLTGLATYRAEIELAREEMACFRGSGDGEAEKRIQDWNRRWRECRPN